MGTAWQINQPPSPAKRSACNRTAQKLPSRCSRREERFICQKSEPFTCLENSFHHVDTRSFWSPDKRSVMIEVIRECSRPLAKPCASHILLHVHPPALRPVWCISSTGSYFGGSQGCRITFSVPTGNQLAPQTMRYDCPYYFSLHSSESC